MKKRDQPQKTAPDQPKEKVQLALKGAERQDMFTTFLMTFIGASIILPFGLDGLIHFHNGWEISTDLLQNGLAFSTAKTPLIVFSVVLALLLAPLIAPYVHRTYASCQSQAIHTENLTRAEIYQIANSSVNQHLAIPNITESAPKPTYPIEYFVVKTESDPDVTTYFVLKIGEWRQALPYKPPFFSLFMEYWGYGGLIHTAMILLFLDTAISPFGKKMSFITDLTVTFSRSATQDSTLGKMIAFYVFGIGVLQIACTSKVIMNAFRRLSRPNIENKAI